MKEKLQNASQFPKRYYGLHFAPGLAEYQQENGVKRVYISEPVAKKMNLTFECKPVYVDHVEHVDVSEIEKSDGYVIRSFYNEADGNHWAEFIVTTDKAHEAIQNGCKLSNCYKPNSLGSAGEWHGMTYDNEILDAEYEHLALVSDPRYAESIILTPEDFKKYNEDKKNELHVYKNEKEKNMKGLNFFKREPLKNAKELETTSVTLPESKKEVTIKEAAELADKFLNEEEKEKTINMEDVVEIDDEKVSIADLVKCYKDSMSEKNEDDEEVEEELDNEDEEKEKEENESEEEKEKKMNRKIANIKKVKEQDRGVPKDETVTLELMQNKLARGKEKYGS